MDTVTMILKSYPLEETQQKPPTFLDLRDLSSEDVQYILTRAEKIKRGDLNVKKMLLEKHFGWLFASTSTRTRVSF